MNTLPIDVVIMIAALLEPKCIVSLCMTCSRFLSQIYNDRLVWLRATRLLIAKECLAPHSLPLDELDATHLRAYACRPDRLRHSITNKSLALNASEIELVYESPTSINLTPLRFDPVLLLGGRWLLDCAVDLHENPYILCWDVLGKTPESLCYPSTVFEPRSCLMLSWSQQLSERDDRATILINGTDEHDDWVHEVVELIWSVDGEPSFQSSKHLILAADDFGKIKASISGDLIILPDHQHVIIWNWINNTWATLRIHTLAAGAMDMLDFWIEGPYIYMVSNKATTISRAHLPPLEPRGVEPPHMHDFSGISWKLPCLPRNREVRYHTVANLGSWYPQRFSPHIYEIALLANYDEYDEGDGGIVFLDTRVLTDSLVHNSENDVRVPLPSFKHHLHSRMHLIGAQEHASIPVSMATGATLNQSKQAISLDMRAYTLFFNQGTTFLDVAEANFVELSVPTGIPWEQHGRLKTTNPPCSISGTFLVSSKRMSRVPGHYSRYTARIWVLHFE